MQQNQTSDSQNLPAIRPLDPDGIDTWIFDLDNTLYPAECDLFGQVERRMAAFIENLLGLEAEKAREVQKRYFHDHGTTLRGLMLNHGVQPQTYLDFVHSIDVSAVPESPLLAAALERLPGRRLVFTNASVRHAERVMERLGVSHLFEGIFDIAAADYLPKPAPESYYALVARYGLRAESCVFFEDMARNLAPAAALGMTTVWIETPTRWGQADADQPYVHHRTRDLPAWLEALHR